MQMHKIEFSNIAAIGYDGTAKVLIVQFKSGDTYRYPDVPLDVAHDFLHAPSKGAYFQQHVRGTYAGTKIVPEIERG